MTQKEKFLTLKSWAEFDERREEFKGMKLDREMVAHMRNNWPNENYTLEELYPYPNMKYRPED